MMQLYIANKNYSTWSMRPWLVLHAFNLPFQEILIPFSEEADGGAFKQQMLALHANGKVPLLQHDGMMIWDSLAICEYLAEQFQDLPLWPKDPAQRAWARSICAEMHSSFMQLRSLCSMNLQADYGHHGQRLWSEHAELRAEVTRIEQIWSSRPAVDGFLCGEFSIADAFFAPVVTRLQTFQLPVSDNTQRYMQKILQHPSVVAWITAAQLEQPVRRMEQYPR
ncbi:glutathione S-transferase family protein [Acinetobacter sp. YH12023]|uniref:glutathione S-transferase family protein n=1 Tax=Acinetobacter sp. YH12023 TaxID=2601041 RepID=UPI0015D41F53|nr:glutathione S-transferase family protein [Acinetobacter sp. YH12023]